MTNNKSRNAGRVSTKSRKGGRPTKYTTAIADLICKRIALGESLLKICRDEGLPTRETVHNWLLDDRRKEFFNKYTQAREVQCEVLADEIVELSDTSTVDIVGDDKSDGARVQARKLQVDARKWYLSKVVPKKWGDKLDVTSGDKPLEPTKVIVGNTIVLADMDHEAEADSE